MPAVIDVNYIMAVNQLRIIPMCRICDHFVFNVGIQNIFMRTRYQEVLQNLDFTDDTKQDKTDIGSKIRPIMDHLNESCQAAFSNVLVQSIDEHIAKFKERSSTRQYLKMKPIKWEFLWWF